MVRETSRPPNIVFVPVRSNAGWFKNIDTVRQLESRLKMAAFCFDKVILENYRYELNVTANGAFEMPGFIGAIEDRNFRFDEGGNVSLSLSPLDEQGKPTGMAPVISGEALVSYHADFVPILKPHGLLRADCFGWINKPLPNDVDKQSKEQAQQESENAEFWKALPFVAFEKGYITQAYYYDLARIKSLEIPTPTFLDHRVSEFVRLKDVQLLDLVPDVMPTIYQAALVSGMPDVSSLSWEEVLQIRNTAVVQSFRDMLARIRASVLYELFNLETQNDVSCLANQFLIKEIMEEIMQFMPSKPGVAFGLALNLVPALGGAIGGAMSIADYIQSRQSWTTLFMSEGNSVSRKS